MANSIAVEYESIDLKQLKKLLAVYQSQIYKHEVNERKLSLTQFNEYAKHIEVVNAVINSKERRQKAKKTPYVSEYMKEKKRAYMRQKAKEYRERLRQT